MNTGFCWGNTREGDHLEEPGIDRWIILKLIFRKWDRGWGAWDGLVQQKKRTGGSLLY